jgi:hypothetical protein
LGLCSSFKGGQRSLRVLHGKDEGGAFGVGSGGKESFGDFLQGG